MTPRRHTDPPSLSRCLGPSACLRQGVARASLLLAVLLLPCACAQTATTPQQHLRRAQELAAQGDHLGAVTEYRLALAATPNSIEAHLGLAQAYEALHDFTRAATEYESILQLKPGHAEAARGAGLARGLLGEHEQAVQLLEIAAKALPRDVEVRQRLGEYYYVLRRPADALRHLQSAEALDKDNVEIALMMARAALQAQDADLAERYYRRALQLDATQLEARRYLLDIYIAREEYGKARALLQALIKQFPKDLALLVELGKLYQAMGDPEEAAKAYEEFAKLAPPEDALRVRLELARAYCAVEEFAKAEVHLRAAVELRPEDVDLRAQLARCLVRIGRFAEAAAQYEQALKRRPDDRALRLGLAEAHEAAAEAARSAADAQPAWLQALGQYELLARADPTDTLALLKVALVAAEAHVPGRAVSMLSALGAEHPTSSEIRLALSDALAAAGDTKAALGQCIEVLRHGPQPEAEWRAARLSERLGNVDAALRHLTSLQQEDPTRTIHLARLGRLLLQQGRPFEAATVLEQLLQTAPDSFLVRSDLAAAYLALGRPERAEELVTAVLQQSPGEPWAVSLLARCYIAREKWEEAAQLYTQLSEREPDDPAHYAGLIATRAREGAPAKACLQLAGLASRPGLNPSAARAIADAYRELGGPGVALVRIRELEAEHPAQATLVAAEADLLHDLGRDPEALARYAVYLQQQPRDVPTARQAASLAHTLAAPQQEVAWLLAVIAERGEDPEALVELAQVSLALGRKADAQVFAERAARAAPADPRAWRLLAEALAAQSGTAMAAQRLRDAADQAKQAAPVLIGYARALALAGRPEEARQVVASLPDEPRGWSEACYVNGLLERAADRPQAAADLLAQAAALQPRPEYALAAAPLLRAAGRTAEALWVCCRVLAAGRADPAVVGVLGELLADEGVPPDAACRAWREALVEGGPAAPVIALVQTSVVPRWPAEATEALGDVARAFPDNEAVWTALAEAAARAGRGDVLIAARRAVVGLRPDDAGALAALGAALRAAGDAAAAVEAYRHALELDPSCAAATEALSRLSEETSPAAEGQAP